MKSWVLLLAALLWARLRLGNAEGDPLPKSLMDLVKDPSITSLEDLELRLMQGDSSTIDKEDKHDSLLSPIHRRYIRSPATETAQKADCKIRTEVMEITRSMVDTSNANFLVWPLCVEVQRCSGCCTSRHTVCIPNGNTTRNLEVKKIVFKTGTASRTSIEKVIVPVVDHVSCRMQSTRTISRSKSSSTAFASEPDPLPPPLQRHRAFSPPLSPPDGSPPKADLHRHDDLKHNQHHQLPYRQDPLARQWEEGSYTQLMRWSHPRVQQAPTDAETGGRLTTAGFLGSVGNWPSEARAEDGVLESPQQVGHESGFDRSREEIDRTEREESGSAVSGDSGRAEAANQEEENDHKLSERADHLAEEERQKKLLQMVRSEPEEDSLLNPHERPKTTMFQSGLSAAVPASKAARQVPFRPAFPRRRKKKHRKRISKAAMRALII